MAYQAAHSPWPWEIGPTSRNCAVIIRQQHDRRVIAQVRDGADAQRIVAAVKACREIPTEDLVNVEFDLGSIRRVRTELGGLLRTAAVRLEQTRDAPSAETAAIMEAFVAAHVIPRLDAAIATLDRALMTREEWEAEIHGSPSRPAATA